MTEYFLNCDEPHWVVSTWTEEMKEVEREIDDIFDHSTSYYWIEASDREEVLKVMDFVMGEDVIKKLSNGTFDDFEDVEEHVEYAEVRESRPPQ